MKSNDVFDWEEYEGIVYEGLEEAIYRVGKKYPEVEFYGLCIDCNAEYGDILLHLNTEADIVKNNKTDKWDVGDWEYFDLIEELQQSDGFFDALWEEKRQYCIDNMFPLDEEWDSGEDPVEDFMIMISKVANKLKTSDAVAKLKKTSDFRILAVDHDEGIEEGVARMKKLETV